MIPAIAHILIIPFLQAEYAGVSSVVRMTAVMFGNTVMGDENMITSKDLLGSVFKTAQMGKFGIEAVMSRAIRPGLQEELRSQLRQYDSIADTAQTIAQSRGWVVDGISPTVKWMSRIMSQANLAGGNTDSKIAGMLIQGNTRGMIKGLKNLNRGGKCDTDVVALAQELVSRERINIQKAQPFL